MSRFFSDDRYCREAAPKPRGAIRAPALLEGQDDRSLQTHRRMSFQCLLRPSNPSSRHARATTNHVHAKDNAASRSLYDILGLPARASSLHGGRYSQRRQSRFHRGGRPRDLSSTMPSSSARRVGSDLRAHQERGLVTGPTSGPPKGQSSPRWRPRRLRLDPTATISNHHASLRGL